MLSVIMLIVIMLNVVMRSVIMLNVVMLSVIMLNVVAPLQLASNSNQHSIVVSFHQDFVASKHSEIFQ